MSGASGTGAPPPGGVVRNSALSFVASAQPLQPSGVPTGNSEDGTGREEMVHADRLMPAGLKALCDACSRVYVDQPNPLQVTTRLKYWLGGHDPLDYISMYWNPGKPEEHIPPHWHYISFGLSDLHGDGRVHPPPDATLDAPPSGFGIELTFRLCAEGTTQPPLWPAALLQALARYVFTTGNKFCPGDHISWHRSLDGRTGAESRVRHLLVAQDPQLLVQNTPHGTVNFLQMVGCTGRELRAAQRGSGFDVLKLIGEDAKCGGWWLVTRMERRRSARGVRGARAGGATLAGVSCALRWRPWAESQEQSPAPSPSTLTPGVEQQIKDTLQRGLSTLSTDRTGPEGHMSTDSFEMSSIERALPNIQTSVQGTWREDCVEYLDGVHIMINAEGASLLPLAVDGRVLQGSHFTWRCGGAAVTLLPPAVTGAFVSPLRPYAVKGAWLQVLVPKELALEMSCSVSSLEALAGADSESDSDSGESPAPPPLPLTLAWPRHRLKITILPDEHTL
ncbi:suppressor of fused homolog [Manduca sexta]|uniref:suppressor of fused homolog n=1 Tax=Manduca sexta TaxID=7130 RepID=UPI00188FB558|nr:suppressor of fused homolog [Manduca sexta]